MHEAVRRSGLLCTDRVVKARVFFDSFLQTYQLEVELSCLSRADSLNSNLP